MGAVECRKHNQDGAARGKSCTSCLDDPNLCLKAEMRPNDAFCCCSHVLLCVNNVIDDHHGGLKAQKQIDRCFPMKPKSMGDPDLHLGGAKICYVTLRNGVVRS